MLCYDLHNEQPGVSVLPKDTVLCSHRNRVPNHSTYSLCRDAIPAELLLPLSCCCVMSSIIKLITLLSNKSPDRLLGHQRWQTHDHPSLTLTPPEPINLLVSGSSHARTKRYELHIVTHHALLWVTDTNFIVVLVNLFHRHFCVTIKFVTLRAATTLVITPTPATRWMRFLYPAAPPNQLGWLFFSPPRVKLHQAEDGTKTNDTIGLCS